MEAIRTGVTLLYFIFERAGNMLLRLGPYVIAGTIVGELIKYTSWTKLCYKALSKSPVVSIAAAVVIGMVSPLCTYGTVPVVLQLYAAGIHIAPLLAFLSSSTLMNPQLFIISWGGLGTELAFVRLGAVFVFGTLFGLVLYKIPPTLIVNKSIGSIEDKRAEILERKPKEFTVKGFIKGSWDSLLYFGFYIMIGILLGAAVEVLVPEAWFAQVFRPVHWISVLLTALMGIPLYSCGGGAIPLLQTFINQGMSRGAALGFLLVGPATRITPLMSLASIVKPLFIVLYVLFLVAFAFTAGLVYG
jgi:uncharacterized membrane protein YraQ (UPF0718 family)